MFYYLSVLSFIVYSFIVTKLFVTSLMSSLKTGHVIISIFKIAVVILLLYEITVEWFVYHNPKKNTLKSKKISKDDYIIFISVFIGTLSSYLLNHTFELGPVVASALIGLIGGILVKKYAVPIYCGSFAGMVSSLVISSITDVIIVAIFSGLLYVLGSETFKGFGGKLGATAYFATLSASLFTDTITHTMTGGDISIQYDVFLVFIIGALGTYFINEHYKIGVVIASSLLGLTSGLILPNVLSNGSSLAVALFCGTFIGMSAAKKLSTRVSVVVASIIGTIIFLYTAPYFAGLGGKLGLIAFGSSISTAGLYNLKNNILSKHLSKKN